LYTVGAIATNRLDYPNTFCTGVTCNLQQHIIGFITNILPKPSQSLVKTSSQSETIASLIGAMTLYTYTSNIINLGDLKLPVLPPIVFLSGHAVPLRLEPPWLGWILEQLWRMRHHVLYDY
jgi:hypothetical protein